MSGAAVIYTAFAVVLTCFLGGVAFFAFLGILLDIAFAGCFVAIAVLTRGGRHSCGSTNPSPIGDGHRASCQLERAVFAISIAGAVLFLVSALLQILLTRNHKKEKRFGPGPSNNYTQGTGKAPFWKRKNKATRDTHDTELGVVDNGVVDNGAVTEKKPPFWKRKNKTTREAELGAVGAGVAAGGLADEKHHHKRDGNFRPSDETGLTGSTAAQDVNYGGPNTRYGQESTLASHKETHVPPVGSATRPDVVVHEPNPYAEVHNGGFVHSHTDTSSFSRTQGYNQ